MIRNLLDNAIRYSRSGTAIEVAVDLEPDEAVVRVLDHGPEPSHGDRPDAIDPSATRAGLAGGGLGLFVAARLIQVLDGRSWARPRPGGGAEFGFALRRSATSRSATPGGPVTDVPAGSLDDVGR